MIERKTLLTALTYVFTSFIGKKSNYVIRLLEMYDRKKKIHFDSGQFVKVEPYPGRE